MPVGQSPCWVLGTSRNQGQTLEQSIHGLLEMECPASRRTKGADYECAGDSGYKEKAWRLGSKEASLWAWMGAQYDGKGLLRLVPMCH